MRKIDFNKKEKYIAQEEEPIRKKRINWDRLVYLAILFFVLGSLVFYLIRNFYFVTAPGQVVKESYVVLFPYDIRLDDVFVKEDQEVKAGQPLLTFERDFRIADNTLANSTRSIDEWITRERFTANRNIQVKTIEIAENEKRKEIIRGKIEQLELMVILDVSNASRIDSHESELIRLEAENNVLREEIKYWRGYLAQLPQYRQEYQSSLLEQMGQSGGLTSFKAPISGVIANINYRKYDLVYKGETILNIELDETYIRAYIPQKEYGSIFEGDLVTIVFPDRTKGKGVIEKIYSGLEKLPPEYQDDTRASVRSLLAIVRPLDNEQEKKWKVNDKLNVEIRKRRFF
ncbi:MULTISPECIES: HlyD family efflux transporter periplasmic adaptor subunit [Roseivirga]|uniref:RND efflux pump membrane fusion protein barrel-sandwich domain-containing protein n=1 Tax=Roseivirga spongicola TaxID=333140 RepID=A0A150XEZ5_9BACT|nr:MULTISPECIES: HlyD family efflux transporter periplasmic adaptor subunit [Roseivirga]PWL30289.1 MAG: hypothetical protein DCO95_10710 [Roseivirga sp. XM-24bin3]KYG77268.1 hypothetical protein AWW68_00420 [Roseivirga spongicola]MBO6497284.1 HlyD family efflux transporter periplasmic adaptor subunit [Roseivirga sp.]MBO6662645.1 HlyD family efflux transporter periplasmic adaptor subunit [Roseivirga sp.]MBO6760424.1 HlyD family efflux transporter periplasmic adaptor subunit [Roseivirga sp.]